MPSVIELTIGQRFGKLIVLQKLNERRNHAIMWMCQCDCGTKVKVRGHSLFNNETTKCRKCAAIQIAESNRVHGRTGTAEYRVWNNILARCHNENNSKYHMYGGKGIKVVEEWHTDKDRGYGFVKFIADMGERPSPKHMLRRHDMSKGFSKENCFWSL